MPKKRDSFLNNRWKRTLMVLSAFVLMYLVSYMLDPFSPYWDDYFERDWWIILEDWVSSFCFCLVISESSMYISKRLNGRLPWTEQPGKRFAVEAGLNLLVVLLGHLVLTTICVYLADEELLSVFGVGASAEETRGMIQWLVVSTIIAFAIIGIHTCNYLILSWKNAALKAAELNQVAMEAELQSLKLQIDPHFVFNNLSVLSELILEDQQLGYEYAENFSRIYRYLLVNSKKDMIPVKEELKFLQAYMFLTEQRFGSSVIFDIRVDDNSRELYMPPLTLQLLMENALKHNRTSRRESLRVQIYTTETQELVVENTLLPLEKGSESSGMGIRNITRRYALLSEKVPVIVKDAASFKVIIPLIRLS